MYMFRSHISIDAITLHNNETLASDKAQIAYQNQLLGGRQRQGNASVSRSLGLPSCCLHVVNNL